MISKFMVFMIALCVLITPVYVLAAEKILPAQANSSAAFKTKKYKADTKIKDIETLVAKIDNGKRASKGDAENLDRLMNEHVKAVDDAVKQTFADADEAKRSKGQKGSTKSFLEFEDMAQKHEKRAKAVEAKIKKIDAQIKTGDVELDQSLIESMTPAERKEYMQYMTPSGREKMKKKHPKFLSGISVETTTKLVDLENIGKSAGWLCRSTAETVDELLARITETAGDLLVPPAEAAIGVSVGVACAGTGPATIIACPAAIITAAVGYSRAYNDWLTCVQGKCGCAWYRPWCCIGRTGCWVVYLATCA